MKELPPPMMVEIHCNHIKPGWSSACGKTLAQLVAGTYFCLCCKRPVKHITW